MVSCPLTVPAGDVLKGSGRATFTSVIRRVTFDDVSADYKPGVSYQGKVTTRTSAIELWSL